MKNTNVNNFLELVIEQEHVQSFKYLIEMIFCNPAQCKIIFKSILTDNNDNKKCDVIIYSPQNEVKFVIKAEKIRYFKCDLPEVAITIDSNFLRNRVQKIKSNDSVIIYMEQTKDNLFIYNLDSNNNIY
ncbi:hypothetical protein QLL95_gp0033 [Cotonvirus japonicus]|uniref:Proliferating cell nuclear antigen n=1 Tax=Cotonvirus japonicus TaxID=2811091 RepID=A0ABM7NQT3_9VIRU|nr:hypothetical protein QLL95_gp0033 [Cotonvirus japonicus]BCS82522.1 hypothetical protein [Cotonvirus japonicus]